MPLERDVSPRDQIQIGAAVCIEFVKIGPRSVRVRIDAPRDVLIHHSSPANIKDQMAKAHASRKK